MKYSRHIIQVTAKTLGGFVRPNMGKFDKCFAPADTMPLLILMLHSILKSMP